METRMKPYSKKVNAMPDIYMDEDNELDAILNGDITPRIRAQLYKVSEPKDSPFFDQVTVLEEKQEPLHCMLLRCFCINCGISHDTFAFLSRKHTETTPAGSVTRYRTVPSPNVNEFPAIVEIKQQTIPFCPTCVKVSE